MWAVAAGALLAVAVVAVLVVVSVVQWVEEQMLQGASLCILCPLSCNRTAAVQATKPTPNS